MSKKSQIGPGFVLAIALIVNLILLTVSVLAMDCQAVCPDGTVLHCSGNACEGIDGDGCYVYDSSFPAVTTCPSN